MQKNKNQILLIGPITHVHGQGRVTYETFKIFKNHSKVDYVNTHIYNLNIVFKLLKSFAIHAIIFYYLNRIIITQQKSYIYFTPSRNFSSSIKDFLLLLSVLILKRFGKNLVLVGHLHGSDLLDLFRNNLYGTVLKYLYKINLDTLIINSETHKEFSMGKYYKKYKIINNPIRIPKNINTRIISKKLYSNGKINILFISIPSKDKGLYESIFTIRRLLNNDNWCFNVVGWNENEFKSIYKNRPELDLKTQKKVNFLGKVNDNEKFKIFLKSHLFILLSFKEAQPLTIIEAGIFKCAIVLSEIEMLLDFKKYETVLYNNKYLTRKKILNKLRDKDNLNKISNHFLKTHSLENYRTSILRTLKLQKN